MKQRLLSPALALLMCAPLATETRVEYDDVGTISSGENGTVKLYYMERGASYGV